MMRYRLLGKPRQVNLGAKYERPSSCMSVYWLFPKATRLDLVEHVLSKYGRQRW